MKELSLYFYVLTGLTPLLAACGQEQEYTSATAPSTARAEARGGDQEVDRAPDAQDSRGIAASSADTLEMDSPDADLSSMQGSVEDQESGELELSTQSEFLDQSEELDSPEQPPVCPEGWEDLYEQPTEILLGQTFSEDMVNCQVPSRFIVLASEMSLSLSLTSQPPDAIVEIVNRRDEILVSVPQIPKVAPRPPSTPQNQASGASVCDAKQGLSRGAGKAP